MRGVECGMLDLLRLSSEESHRSQKFQLIIAVNKPHCGETEGDFSAGSGTPRRAERLEPEFLFGVDS